MLIEIISQEAEEALIALLEQASRQNASWGALLFESSKLKARPTEEGVLTTTRPALENKPCAIYFLRNGDIIITWKGMQKATLEDLCHRLYERYAAKAAEKLHTYYDMQAQGEDLRLICKRTLPAAPNGQQAAATLPKEMLTHGAPLHEKIHPTAKQIADFHRAARKRHARYKPDILVVEDQAFSNKLLVGMLHHHYICHTAMNAAEALDLYCKHAPDIAFLDIELPDLSGHDLAAVIREFDPDAYLFMVTANNYTQDVLRAKANGVRGFIAKPYNRTKIQEGVEQYLRDRK